MTSPRERTTKHRSPRSLRALKPRGIDLAFYWDRHRPRSPETLHTLGKHKPAETTDYAGKIELFNRVVAGGLKTLNTEERQLVEQSRRNRRKALRQAGATHDPLNPSLKP